MKTILIYGEPATGKTTIMRFIVNKFNAEKNIHFTPFAHHVLTNKLIVFGDYSNPNEVFAGTDRLSMAVQPLAIQRIVNDNNGSTFLIEGNRLFTRSFIECVKPEIVIIRATPEQIKLRIALRSSNQPFKFLQACKTRIDNITKDFPHHVLHNGELGLIEDCVNAILDISKGDQTHLQPPTRIQSELF